jgi:hypothetical protein
MDNRVLDVVSVGDKALALALELAWHNAPGGKATHYKIVTLKERYQYWPDKAGVVIRHSVNLVEDPTGTPTLILLWHEEKNALALAYPHTLPQAVEFTRGWLGNVDYGEEPDHDGSNGKGWRVFTEGWGRVLSHNYTIVGVQPNWAMYGK